MQPGRRRLRAELIGRKAERELLERLLCGLRGSGEGAIVAISGEPGIGKSRLLEECAHSAGQAGVVPLVGDCSSAGAAPYEPWQHVVARYVSSFGYAEVARRLDHDATELNPLLPDATRGGHVDKRSADRGATDRRESMSDALATLFSSHGPDSPLFIGIDDLHRASRHTMDTLLLIGGRIVHSAVLLVFTYRSTGELSTIAPVLAGFSRSAGYHDIVLEGLSRSDCRSVLEIVSESPITEDIASSVTSRTGGNPLYVQEIGRSMRSGLASSAPDSDGVRAIVISRLAELDHDAEALVRAVAALGDEVELRTLRSSLPRLSGLQIAQAVEESIHQHLLVPASTDGRYRFRHDVLRDAVLSAMGRAEVADVLARVVTALDSQSNAMGATEVTRGASYCLRAIDALDTEVVVRWVVRAATLSLESYAPDGAAELIDPLLPADSHGMVRLERKTRGDLLALRARAAHDLDQEDDQIRYLTEAFDTYESAGLAHEAIGVALTPAYEYMDPHAQAVWIRGHRGIAALRLRAERYAVPNSATHVRLLAQSGDRRSLDKALRVSMSLDDDATQLSVLLRFAYFAALDWDFTTSVHLNDRAREIAHRLGDAEAQFWILYTDAVLSTLTGTHRSGTRIATELLEAADALRLKKLRSIAHRCRAQVDAMQGRFHDALRGIDLAGNITTASSDSLHNRLLAIERSIILAETQGPPDPAAQLPAPLARVYLAVSSGDRTMWQAILAEADSNATTGPPLTFRSGSIGLQANAVVELEHKDRAGELLDRLQPFAGSFLGFYPGYFGVPADVQIGRLQVLLGDVAGGSDSIERGLELCRRAGRQPALAWSLFEYARALRRERSTAPERIVGLARQSLDIAHHLGVRTLETLCRSFIDETDLPAHWRLSPREVDVLGLIGSGFTNSDIAGMLHISSNTVAKHVHSILTKTGSANRAEAAVLAAEHDLLRKSGAG